MMLTMLQLVAACGDRNSYVYLRYPDDRGAYPELPERLYLGLDGLSMEFVQDGLHPSTYYLTNTRRMP